jgi:hypothetical protein
VSTYASLTELKRFLTRYPIDSTTEPSDTDCQLYLDQIEARINGFMVGAGYTIPITGVQSLLMLKDWTLVGAAWYTTRIMFPGAGQGVVTSYRDEFNAMIQQFVSGMLVLPDAGKDATNKVMDGSNSTAIFYASSAPFVSRSQQF